MENIKEILQEEIKEIEMNMLRDRCPKLPDITEEDWKQLDINEFNREIIEEFLIENPDLRPKTLKQYRSGLQIFAKWLMDTLNNKNIYDVKKKDFLRYQNFLIRRGMSSSGISFKRSSVSTLCNYLENYYVGEDTRFDTFRNFVKGVPKPSPNQVYNKVLISKEEYELIKTTLLEDKKYRDYAMFVVAMETGMRGGELRQIKFKELSKTVDEESGYFLTDIIFGKGKGEGKPLEYMVNQVAFDAMKLYAEHRLDCNCEYLFVTNYNGIKQVSESYFETICREVISDIVGRRINEHLCRASCATNKLLEGVPEILVSKYILHHNDLSTLKYYDLRDFKEERAKIFGKGSFDKDNNLPQENKISSFSKNGRF